MDLNSPVKMMLPQEVKAPLVPDSGMYTENSTMGSAVDKRKAGPDALSAPDAKKLATSCDSSTEEDETPLEGFVLPKGYSLYVEDEPAEDYMSEDYMFLRVDYVYDTTADNGFEDLENVVARDFERDSEEFIYRVEAIKEAHYLFVGKHKNCGKLQVTIDFDKSGEVVLGGFDFIN